MVITIKLRQTINTVIPAAMPTSLVHVHDVEVTDTCSPIGQREKKNAKFTGANIAVNVHDVEVTVICSPGPKKERKYWSFKN